MRWVKGTRSGPNYNYYIVHTCIIGIAMVLNFVFSPYILKHSSYFQFQASLTFNEIILQYNTCQK